MPPLFASLLRQLFFWLEQATEQVWGVAIGQLKLNQLGSVLVAERFVIKQPIKLGRRTSFISLDTGNIGHESLEECPVVPERDVIIKRVETVEVAFDCISSVIEDETDQAIMLVTEKALKSIFVYTALPTYTTQGKP